MPEKRKTESESRDNQQSFPAKRARQQISYDDLDDSVHSPTVVRPEPPTRNDREDEAAHASENEGDEANWAHDSKDTASSNKQSSRQRHNQLPRLDPVYGQRSAFPGLDDTDSDALLYGPPEDGLEYLRLVR